MSLLEQFKQIPESKILLLEVSYAKRKALLEKMLDLFYEYIPDEKYKEAKNLLNHNQFFNRLNNTELVQPSNSKENYVEIRDTINTVGVDELIKLLPNIESISKNDRLEPDEPLKQTVLRIAITLASVLYLFKILEDIDPTKNMKYGNWLVDRLIKNAIEWNSIKLEYVSATLSALNIFNGKGIFFEDIPKVSRYLEIYDEAKRKNNLPEEYKDLMAIEKIETTSEGGRAIELTSPVSILKEITKDLRAIKEKDVFKVVDNMLVEREDYYVIAKDVDGFNIYEPLTQKGKSILGLHTEWCTTYGEYCSISSYQDRTPMDYDNLYILIDISTQEQFQFHFGSNQFMDAKDNGIDIFEFFYENRDVFRVLIDEVPADELKQWFMRNDGGKVLHKIIVEEESDELFKKVLTKINLIPSNEIVFSQFKIVYKDINNPYIIARGVQDLKELYKETDVSDEEFLRDYFEASINDVEELEGKIKINISSDYAKRFIMRSLNYASYFVKPLKLG